MCCSEANEAVGVKNTLPQCLFGRRLSIHSGKKIVVDKKEYQSGGLYVPFPVDYEQPFEHEIETIDHGWCIVQNVGRLSLS